MNANSESHREKNSPSDDTGLQDSDFQLSSYIGCYKLNATQTQNPPLQNLPHVPVPQELLSPPCRVQNL